MTRPVLIAGGIGSPYTRKMQAIARYRRIPHRFLQTGMPGAHPDWLPKPPLPLLPCVYLPEGDDAYRGTSDSTFQLRELEARFPGRSVLPPDPALAFLDYLIEDYADEWVTKMMFHYRWGPEEGVANASQILPLWRFASDDAVAQFRNTFAQRQIDRLQGIVAGSLEVTGPLIEACYHRLLAILLEHFRQHRFILGRRPSAGDFALYGQLSQLVQVEPTSMAVARAEAPRVLAWVDVVDDLSGLDVSDGDWLDRAAASVALRPLLTEIGRSYAPFMVANAQALDANAEEMAFTLDGVRYWQRPFPYQKKCLHWLREGRAALSEADRDWVDGVLAGTGCTVLFT